MREATFRSPGAPKGRPKEKELLSGTNTPGVRTYRRAKIFGRAKWWRFGSEKGREGGKRSGRVRRGKSAAGRAKLFS